MPMPTKPTTSGLDQITDPLLRDLATRVVQSFQLAAERALGHQSAPAKYPLPTTPGSAEEVVLALYRKFSPDRQRAAVQAAMTSLSAPPADRQRRYGELAKVNLSSAVPVET